MNIKDNPLVSIVMAVYNTDKYLKESIESILSQTYSNFEFIIINDASSDKSESIIRNYAKKDVRIIYLENKVNSKQSKTRNIAINKANGKYIAIVDSDDVCLHDRIEKQVYFLNKNPDVDVLGSSYCLFYNNINESNGVVSASMNDLYDGKPPVHNPTCMIKKEIFDKYGYYDSKYDNAEDVEMWFRWFSQGVRFDNIPEVLYKKRIHSGCVSVGRIKHQIFLLLKINITAIVKYHMKFTRKGYLYVLEQFLYLIYLLLRLDRIYVKDKASYLIKRKAETSK